MKPVGNEGDILHAWPEYYDFQTQQWLAVDHLGKNYRWHRLF